MLQKQYASCITCLILLCREMADNASDTGAGQSEQFEQTQPNGHTTAPQQTLRVRNERRERDGRGERERERERGGGGRDGERERRGM